MKNRIAVLFLGMAGLLIPAVAQNSQLPLPSPVEKELAAKASNVTEVTLGKNMLAFAAKFMNGKEQDEAATQRLIAGPRRDLCARLRVRQRRPVLDGRHPEAALLL